MEISEGIKAEAKRLIQEGVSLPAKITLAPHFYVARHEDSSIQAFGSVLVDDAFFKIGTPKKEKHENNI